MKLSLWKGDMYWISYAMMIIAFFAIPIVCFGFMSQASWHYEHEDHLDDPDGDDGFFNMGRQLSRKASSRLGLGIDDNSQAMAATQQHIEFGINPVGPAEGGFNPAPPASAPPGSPSWEAGTGGHRDSL